MTSLDESIAKLLALHQGWLKLNGIKTMDDKVIRLLAGHDGRVSLQQIEGFVLLKLSNHERCRDWRNFIPNKTQVRSLLDQKHQGIFDSLIQFAADKPELAQWLLEVIPDELDWLSALSPEAADLLAKKRDLYISVG